MYMQYVAVRLEVCYSDLFFHYSRIHSLCVCSMSQCAASVLNPLFLHYSRSHLLYIYSMLQCIESVLQCCVLSLFDEPLLIYNICSMSQCVGSVLQCFVLSLFDEPFFKQPVPEKMRPAMIIGIQNGILNGRSSGIFSNEPYYKRAVMIIQGFRFGF